MEKKKLAIVGATGLVGQSVLEIIKQENMLQSFDITLFASALSAGKRIVFGADEYKIIALSDENLVQKFDYAIFSAGGEISKVWVPKFVNQGTVVIDNTSVFRKQKNIPLVVPEINRSKLSSKSKIIANPNCSSIQLVLVLDKLLKLSKIDKVIVSTYQSVSGAGRRALSDLKQNTNNVFKSGINDNIIPQIGDEDGTGFCAEERKLMFETNKILETDISVLATAVRVPISYCHGESVYIKFENSVGISEIINAIRCDYIVVKKSGTYLPKEVAGTNKTYVCRVRKVSKNEIALFIFADNLRRGAAYNAVKILQQLLFINQ